MEPRTATAPSTTQKLNDQAIRALASAPAHTGAMDCPCRACFFRDDRPRYWTSTGEVTS